jgi:hypothetical protein
MIHELANPFKVDTPLGRALALFVESTTTDNYWTCVILDNGAIVTFTQDKIRMARAYTLGVDFTHGDMLDCIRKR